MASTWMYRGRNLRNNRSIRSRRDSEDEVNFEPNKDETEITNEILCNIFRRQGVSEERKLSYLNYLVNFISKKESFPNFGYNIEEILCCLRVSLVHEAPQIRAAGLRSIRHLLRDEQDVIAFIRLQIPALVARSIDIVVRNDVERVQAVRLCRCLLRHAPHLFPRELARCLVSLAAGGTEERDKLLRVCLATLSELAVVHPTVFISSGGVTAISRNILESHPPRVIEALSGTLLMLLTRPSTRQSANVDLSLLAAPYSDLHYKHSGFERDKDERETRLSSAKLALLSILRSFPGLLHFCQPHKNSGLKSLVDVLALQQLEARKAVLDLLYDLLGLPLPSWTDEASVALEAVDPSKMQDAWKLTEGFVAAEGKAILPNLSRYRPNLAEVHTALLLYTFVSAGLLEALVEVIVTSDSFISLRAAILLGELLQLIQSLLPVGCCCSVPSLPSLLSHASGSGSLSSRQAALSALATLSRLHATFKKRPAPCSLFLDQLLTFTGLWQRETIAGHKLPKSQLYQMMTRDSEDSIKASVVLSNKDPFFWNWNVIRSILRSRCDSFRRLDDSSSRTFVRRLVEYFKPSSKRFSMLKLGQRHTHPYTLAGCELLDFLVEAEEGEAGRALAELLEDICKELDCIHNAPSAHDCLFSPYSVTHSFCQDYFLFIGRLSHHRRGTKALEHAGIFQRLLDLSVSTKHDCYVKLIVSSLDYSIEGMPRVILGKILKSPVESSRLYSTRFLLVLARARVADFAKWGIELLAMQLYDTSTAVSLAASDVLDEACDHKPYLESLVGIRPSLLHLGDRGLLLLIRFLSLPIGFSYLHDANFVNNEIQRWNSAYNTKYVHIVEAVLHDALTFHQKGESGSYTGRLSSAKHLVKDAFLPPHLLGQLAQHARGLELMAREMTTLQRHCQIVRAAHYNTDEEVLFLKSSIWAVAHACSSPGGLLLVSEAMDSGVEGLTVADCLATLAEESPHYGIRATAFYACALLATTQPGVQLLENSGWVGVKHSRHDRFPVTEGDEGLPPIPVEGELARDTEEFCVEIRESRRKRSTSQCSTQSAASSSWAAHFFISDDDTEEDISERGGYVQSPKRESGVSMSPPSITIKPPPPHSLPSQTSHRRSQTLPHSKPPKAPKHHQRSLSESKGDVKSYNVNTNNMPDSPRRNSLTEKKNDRVRKKGVSTPVPLELLERREERFLSVSEEKSRSNSCTDSGVSSCDDYAAKASLGDRVMTTLSPIPSSASLSTLRSAGQLARGESARIRALSTNDDGDILAEAERTASWQDIQGFAALRAHHRFRTPLYSESSTADILLGPDRIRQQASHASLDVEVPMLRRVASSLSSVCSRPPTVPSVSHSGQCYRGIALPTEISAMFPQNVPNRLKVPTRGRKRAQESFSELEDVKEAVGGQEEVSSLSGEEMPGEGENEHDASRCLACCPLKPPPLTNQRNAGRRMSRTRTDTESSGGPGDSPVLGKRTTALLVSMATPNSASSTSSLDLGLSQTTEEAAAALSKHAVRKEILKHIERLANPVWAKSSRQILLQLKQKFPLSFHDVCLYSDVSVLLANCSYRLSSRHCLQELFLDCPFEELYEEPAVILKLQDVPSISSAQVSPFSSPSITIAESLDCSEMKLRALDVVTEEHSAASGSGELTDLPATSQSPSVLNFHNNDSIVSKKVTTGSKTKATSESKTSDIQISNLKSSIKSETNQESMLQTKANPETALKTVECTLTKKAILKNMPNTKVLPQPSTKCSVAPETSLKSSTTVETSMKANIAPECTLKSKSTPETIPKISATPEATNKMNTTLETSQKTSESTLKTNPNYVTPLKTDIIPELTIKTKTPLETSFKSKTSFESNLKTKQIPETSLKINVTPESTVKSSPVSTHETSIAPETMLKSKVTPTPPKSSQNKQVSSLTKNDLEKPSTNLKMTTESEKTELNQSQVKQSFTKKLPEQDKSMSSIQTTSKVVTKIAQERGKTTFEVSKTQVLNYKEDFSKSNTQNVNQSKVEKSVTAVCSKSDDNDKNKKSFSVVEKVVSKSVMPPSELTKSQHKQSESSTVVPSSSKK